MKNNNQGISLFREIEDFERYRADLEFLELKQFAKSTPVKFADIAAMSIADAKGAIGCEPIRFRPGTEGDLMDNAVDLTNSARAVRLEFRDGKWFVKVRDDEGQHELEFILEAHAHAYADGQRIRLGLYNIAHGSEDGSA